MKECDSKHRPASDPQGGCEMISLAHSWCTGTMADAQLIRFARSINRERHRCL